jgi:hypothetical protein
MAHPGQRCEDRPSQHPRPPRPVKPPKPPKIRTCARCGVVKPTGKRCGTCKNELSRERYRADPEERARQKARVKRNRERRRVAALSEGAVT